MAGMGLQGAAGAVGGFEGIRKWLADARALQGIEQANEDRSTGIQRQAMLDERAVETHGLNMQRGRQVIDLAAAGEGRAVADDAAEQAAAAAAGQDTAALEQQIDADPNLSQIQKLVFKASLRRGGSLPAGLLEQPKAPKIQAVRTVDERGRPVTKFLPEDQIAGQTFQEYREPKAPAQGPQPGFQWVDRGGKPVYTNQVQPGDAPHTKDAAKPPTAQNGSFAADLDTFSTAVFNHKGLPRAGAGLNLGRSYNTDFGNLKAAEKQLVSLYLSDPEVQAKIAAQKPATNADVERALRSAVNVDVESMDQAAIRSEINRLRTKAGLKPLGMVRLKAPDGSTREVSQADADHYVALGAKVVP